MFSKKIFSYLILSSLFSINAYSNSPGEYKCYTDQAVGYTHSGSSWKPTTFNNKSVFSIGKALNGGYDVTSDSGYWFGFTDPKFGDLWVTASNTALDKFTMNTKTLRFTAAYFGGYANGHTNHTPMLFTGKCRAVRF